jgi:hypothetical protein
MDDKGGRPREEENGTRFASQLPITYFQGQHITKHSKSRIGDDHFYHANIELLVIVIHKGKTVLSAKMMITRHE